MFALGVWLWLGCGLAFSLVAAPANYIARVWRSEHGLPMDTVTAVRQTRDGYVWVVTRSGLARFDGVRFTAFDGPKAPRTGSPHVTSLYEATDGALWIGHEDGAITRFHADSFTPVPIPGHAGWRGGKIFAITADAAGDVWLMNQEGELVRVRDGHFIPAPATNVTRLVNLVGQSRGEFWVQRGNDLAVVAQGRLQVRPLAEPGSSPYYHGLGLSHDGGVWIFQDARIRKWKDGNWVADLGPAPGGYTPASVVLETRNGHLAVGTADHGLYLIVPGERGFHFCRTNGFASDWITALCEDREGNLWVGTGNNGLAMLQTKNVEVIAPPNQWQGRAVLSVTAAADGGLWVGTEGAGLYSYRAGAWKQFTMAEGIASHYVWGTTEDADGYVWASTWSGSLFKQNQNQFELVPELAGFSAPIPALLPSSRFGMLVGSGAGLFQYQSNQVTWLARKPELQAPDVRAIVETPEGDLWFGMSGGGLGWWRAGQVRQFLRADGLASDYVRCLHRETNGVLWAGTFNGLSRFQNGRFATINKSHGLPSDVICSIQDDAQGYFWLSSHQGIARVSREELNECAEGRREKLRVLTYGLADGLPSLESSGGFQSAGCQTPDGRLWFPTSKGLVAIDPTAVPTNSLPPPVIIEQMLVDDQPVLGGTNLNSVLEIAPGRHRFEFQFTGLSFAAPERVRFRYRMAGLDEEWQEVQSPRAAYYSHIPPGAYQFQVRACNNDGVWSEAEATVAFTVLPAFWQTWWFRVLVGILTAVAGGGIVWLDARRRMRRKLERLERERAVQNERARIAQDIHDDLGASLTRISLLSGSVPREEATLAQTTEVLDRIFETTNEMTEVMDEIVWAVNPQHDTLDSLGTYLGKFAQDFLGSAGVRCRLDVPVHLPNWRLDADARHNLFLAFKECLNNVVRHAGATEVQMALTVGPDAFTLVVQDNGKGYTTASLRQRGVPGNGLTNLRQRLAMIGGSCEINSEPGQGTRVEFHLARPAGEPYSRGREV